MYISNNSLMTLCNAPNIHRHKYYANSAAPNMVTASFPRQHLFREISLTFGQFLTIT